MDDNRSWNCGIEGCSDDLAVEDLRNRQVKNFLTITMLSAGIPMILMGDEVRRTQQGNNNAYCQDNEISWFDWGLLQKHADVHRFVTLLNARRRLRNTTIERERISLNRLLRAANLSWHGVKVGKPDWAPSSHTIALTVEMREERLRIHLIVNAFWKALDFELPQIDTLWRRWINTGLGAPQDIVHWEAALAVSSSFVRAEPRSVIVLFAEL
jgi:glycogen operon protein